MRELALERECDALYIYNIPSATGVTIGAGLVRKLFEDNVIQGLKFTDTNQLGFRDIIDSCKGKLNIFSGPDEMLLSGVLVGGQALANRAQVVDAPLGSGHVVMFAIRPYWRWQTQGTYFLGFNAIMNWNDLGAGR